MSTFLWCGRPIEYLAGETIAAALLRAGIFDLTPSTAFGTHNRVFCGIGSCQACLVRHDDEAALEACLTPASATLRLTPVLRASQDESFDV